MTSTRLPDVTDVTVPVLFRIPPLGLTVAAYTDGFDHYLAEEELAEIWAHSRGGFPRVARRRAGGWQVESGSAQRAVVLGRALIDGRVHYLTGAGWPWPRQPVAGPAA